jgi:ubiquinone/menaquinone biosynthesis C-methylase UbiE
MSEASAELKRQEYLAQRTLDDSFPELKPYLEQGATLLDVGCGPGNITLDVAKAVKPGTVTGIDRDEGRIQVASQKATERGIGNVVFEVGDSSHIRFPDDTFDLVYSHTVLHFFYDPERALREQARVVKPGGWVVCAGVRDPHLVPRYPPCPAWEQVHEARMRYVEMRGDGVNENRQTAWKFGQFQAGRRCPEWFAAVGLTDVKIDVKPITVNCAGAHVEPKFRVMDMLPHEEADEYGFYAAYRQEYDEMIAEGFLDRATLEQAMVEAKAWYADPRAFHFKVVVFAAGRA